MATAASLETFSDKARAYALALLVHVAVVALLMVGVLLVPKSPPPLILAGPIIEAELVGISAAPKPPRASSHAKPTPKPAAEPPKPPDPVPQPPTQTRNDQIEREKVAEMADQKAEQARRAEEEKHKQEQVLLEDQQRERAKQLEQVKRERAEAEKKLKLEKEKLAQLNDLQKQQTKPVKAVTQQVPEAEQAKSGANGQDTGIQAEYYAAIQNAVKTNWLRPDNAQAGVRCMVRIVQIPGGEVIGVQIANPCNADPQTRNTIEQAVKRAAPLPYKGYESVFARDINFNFTYDG